MKAVPFDLQTHVHASLPTGCGQMDAMCGSISIP
jgi:hypothetical protein